MSDETISGETMVLSTINKTNNKLKFLNNKLKFLHRKNGFLTPALR